MAPMPPSGSLPGMAENDCFRLKQTEAQTQLWMAVTGLWYAVMEKNGIA
jgi:hypothetical protein